MTKMQKITGKLGFLAKAVEDADLKGVKEFGSDLKKLGMPLEHSPQVIAVLLNSFSVNLLELTFLQFQTQNNIPRRNS